VCIVKTMTLFEMEVLVEMSILGPVVSMQMDMNRIVQLLSFLRNVGAGSALYT